MRRLALLCCTLLSAVAAKAQSAPGQIVAQPENQIWIAAQPDQADLDAWAAAGVAVVINSRSDKETEALPFDFPAAVRERGMNYVALPIGRAHGWQSDTAGQLTDVLFQSDGIVVLQCRTGNRSLHAYAAHLVETGRISFDMLGDIQGHRPIDVTNVRRLVDLERVAAGD